MIPLTLVPQEPCGFSREKALCTETQPKSNFFISHHKINNYGYGHEYLELFVECHEFSKYISTISTYEKPAVPFCAEKDSETQFAFICINICTVTATTSPVLVLTIVTRLAGQKGLAQVVGTGGISN